MNYSTRHSILAAALLAGVTTLPFAAQAQQRVIVEEGTTTGLATAPGGGVIPDEERPHFRQYIVEERVPSYRVEAPVRRHGAA